MPMVIVGVLLLVAWMADFGPFGRWPWWAIALPFVFAVLWWQFADSSGWTQRRAMDKMEKKKAERREKAMVALGRGGKVGRGGRPATRGRGGPSAPKPPDAK